MALTQSNVRGGHFLDENLGLFDAAFFNLTSAEARVSLCQAIHDKDTSKIDRQWILSSESYLSSLMRLWRIVRSRIY